MPPRLRWAWPVALAAAAGITISAAAQTFGGRTVPIVKPRVSGGTNVTPELFDPHAMSGKPNDAAPAPAPSVSLAPLPPPRFDPVPGSQRIVPAPLARPIEPEVGTATTEQAAEPSAPPPSRAAEAPPEKETVRSPAPPAKPRQARRPPAAAKSARKERTPARDAKASGRADKPASGTSPRAQTRARKTPAPAAPALPSAGATDAQIIAAFKSLELDEQQRVRQRCKKMLVNSKEAEAGELRVCRAISASS